MSKIAVLLRKDARGIYRDGFLLYLCAYAPLVALAARAGVPWIPLENLGLYVGAQHVQAGVGHAHQELVVPMRFKAAPGGRNGVELDVFRFRPGYRV